MARLSLSHLTKVYGSHLALDSICLEVEPGEFIALLGPSGCGKTTTLRLVAGFEEPTSGEIRYGDACLAAPGKSLPPEDRNMAVVFQSYALWPHLSVADNVGYPLKIRNIRGKDYKDQVRQALSTVEMEEFARRRPADLSGGQRQRVALARCLVMTPSVVLLDEPLANLDRHLRSTMEAYFSRFHQTTGATMLYVTHDQGEAMAMADRIAVMRNGRIEQTAVPEQLYREPASPAVARFIGEGAQIRAQYVQGPRAFLGSTSFPFRHQNGCSSEDSLIFSVRPEDVTITDNGQNASVIRCQYRGERYLLTLVLEDGQQILAYSRFKQACGDTLCLTVKDAWRIPDTKEA